MGGRQSKPTFRALILGLDSAGKTTLLKGLTGQSIQEGPTASPNTGQVRIGNVSGLLFDLGGQQRLISFWRQYYTGTGIILFIIDSCDTQRISSAKAELYKLLHEEPLLGTPLLILANKQDMQGALRPEEIAAELELEFLAPRTVKILGTSAKNKEGLDLVKAWIEENAVCVDDLPRNMEEYNRKLQQFNAQHRSEASTTSSYTSPTTGNNPATTNDVVDTEDSISLASSQQRTHQQRPRLTISLHDNATQTAGNIQRHNVEGAPIVQEGDEVLETLIKPKEIKNNNNNQSSTSLRNVNESNSLNDIEAEPEKPKQQRRSSNSQL